jgi:predicted lipid-binding transport protein (Tim44 family)
MRRRTWVLLAIALLLVCGIALARPGGGQSYSGGGSGGGGGGGGDGGDSSGLVYMLIWLCIEHPAIGIPLTIIIIIVAIVRRGMRAKQKEWQTSAAAVPYQRQVVAQAPTGVPRSQLQQIRAVDPNFSVVLFEDFVYTLYAEMQRARAGSTASLAAFVQAGALQPDPNIGEVRGIVIGAMRYIRFSGARGPAIQLEVEFEANYVEAYRQGGERRFYVVDRITMHRATTAKSRPPGRARTLDCPNCGAPLQHVRGTQCTYCKQDVGGGRFDWNVDGIRTLSKEQRGPLLTSDTPEVGTDQPTRVDPGAQAHMQGVQQRDPAFNWNAFQARVNVIYTNLNAAWWGRDPPRIRPFVSDNLFQSMMYWIDLYMQNRCRNANENARILRIDLANCLSDAVYDAITVRVFAAGLDYTISDDGRMLSGSRSKERTYSEYWTLIRGTQRKGQPKGDQNCPSCGAPLKISMVGNCEYCKVKVTAGEFDWVLSRIEQDESYTG